jgi:hypothetical protein
MDLSGMDLGDESLPSWPPEPSTSAKEALVEEANEEVPAEEALAEEDLVELEVLVGSDAEAVEPSVGEHTSTREICAEEPSVEVGSTEEALVEGRGSRR